MAQVCRVAKEIRSVLSQFTLCSFLKHAQPGDLIYLNAAGQPIVILNSHKVAGDLLDRRATTYSDRPRSIVAGDIMTGGFLFALGHYDDVWVILPLCSITRRLR
jgi:hypothetical protein